VKTKNVSCENCGSKDKGIFCQLDHEALGQVSAHKVMNNYKKGQTIFYQGNPPFGLYCINNGKIKVSRLGNDGKETIVRIAGAGDVLGHRSLFSNENYEATATALDDVAICFLDKKFIHEAIKEEPSVALNLIQKLSKEMGAAEARNASMFQKSVRERLAELLMSLKTTFGIKEGNSYRLDIKLTREEMASMIGTTNETVIRIFSDFKEEGFIRQEGKIIFIEDEEALLDVANFQY
jgi:CRP-like cAMP-binding protein